MEYGLKYILEHSEEPACGRRTASEVRVVVGVGGGRLGEHLKNPLSLSIRLFPGNYFSDFSAGFPNLEKSRYQSLILNQAEEARKEKAFCCDNNGKLLKYPMNVIDRLGFLEDLPVTYQRRYNQVNTSRRWVCAWSRRYLTMPNTWYLVESRDRSTLSALFPSWTMQILVRLVQSVCYPRE